MPPMTASHEPIAAESPLPGTVAIGNVFLHVTKACNLRCAYCYFSADRPMANEMTSDEMASIWPDLVALAPHKVIFTGGEPLLRRDLLDLLAGLRAADPEHRVRRCLNTNGHLMTADRAQGLIGLVDEVRVSLDALAGRNDAGRGAGNFAAVLAALDHLLRAGFEPRVLITVTAATLPDLEDLLCYLIERRISRINVNPFRAIGRGAGQDHWRVGTAAINAVLDRARERDGGRIEVTGDPVATEACINCGVGRHLNIMPNGVVYPCHVLADAPHQCGNLRRESLLDICRDGRLLHRLSGLDFRDLAASDPNLRRLTTPGACLGDVISGRLEVPT